MQFNQPDTIVPNLSNPQSLNRYSYAMNNPIMLNDPTGHDASSTCGDNTACMSYVNQHTDLIDTNVYKANDLKKKIKKEFNWNLKGNNWSLTELQGIYQTGLDIENYINYLTGGNGSSWMNKYMSHINISIDDKTRGNSVPGSISLPNWWNGGDRYDKYYFAHELIHTWDIKMGHIGMVGIVDGPADYLNDFINHDNGIRGSWSCRFCDGSGYDHIPGNYLFTSGVMLDQKGRPYGNNSTADYLAESFTLNLYYPEAGHVNSTVTLWINALISVQGSNLP